MTAPATVEFLARDYTWEINAGTVDAPDFVEIGGLNKWAHKPSAKDAETTKFSDAGRQSHMKASRGDEFTLSGLLGVTEDDLDERDPGQLEVESASTDVGRASRHQFRCTRDEDGATRTFMATCTTVIGGGGNDDPDMWEATLTVTGAISDSSAPAVPDVPTSVAGTNATAGTLVSWTDGAGSPTQYEVVVTNSAGDTVLATVRSDATPVWVPVSSGSRKAKVRSRNAGGWSQFSSLSASITVS